MSVNKSVAIAGEAIRDTNPHYSDIVYNGEFAIKTLIIENLLNQAVSFQCQGSANSDFSNPFNIGSSFEVGAGVSTYMTCDSYIPYWRMVASCASAPSSGNLTLTVFGVS